MLEWLGTRVAYRRTLVSRGSEHIHGLEAIRMGLVHPQGTTIFLVFFFFSIGQKNTDNTSSPSIRDGFGHVVSNRGHIFCKVLKLGFACLFIHQQVCVR